MLRSVAGQRSRKACERLRHEFEAAQADGNDDTARLERLAARNRDLKAFSFGSYPHYVDGLQLRQEGALDPLTVLGK